MKNKLHFHNFLTNILKQEIEWKWFDIFVIIFAKATEKKIFLKLKLPLISRIENVLNLLSLLVPWIILHFVSKASFLLIKHSVNAIVDHFYIANCDFLVYLSILLFELSTFCLHYCISHITYISIFCFWF